jgi:hypothetical protein
MRRGGLVIGFAVAAVAGLAYGLLHAALPAIDHLGCQRTCETLRAPNRTACVAECLQAVHEEGLR